MLINGKSIDFERELTVSELLTELKFKSEYVVVEVNRVIIEKDRFDALKLDKRDEIEIVGFVGGG